MAGGQNDFEAIFIHNLGAELFGAILGKRPREPEVIFPSSNAFSCCSVFMSRN